VRQLITRIDDDLHERLKARAAAEGRSMNAYVADVLTRAVRSGNDTSIRERLAREGLLATPPRPAGAPTRDDVVALTRGAGTAASEALERDRRRG
jgi:plasmid stability protein